MKIKKGILRIYIVIGGLWSAFWFWGAEENETIFRLLERTSYLNANDYFLLIMIILPLPFYYIFKWVMKGFSE
jgi:hypothetical protein